MDTLEPNTAALLVDGLESLVREVLEARGQISFGQCKTCRYHKPGKTGGYCTLPNESLTHEESHQFCLEHLRATQTHRQATSLLEKAAAGCQNFEVGIVCLNLPIPVPMAFHGFGGWKSSILGNHHMQSMEGVRPYTRIESTTTR